MKKIFYIVLVIVALMVIGRFVKEGNKETAAPAAVENIAVEDVEIAAPDGEVIEETVVEGVEDNGMEEETVISEDEAPAEDASDSETAGETEAAVPAAE